MLYDVVVHYFATICVDLLNREDAVRELKCLRIYHQGALRGKLALFNWSVPFAHCGRREY